MSTPAPAFRLAPARPSRARRHATRGVYALYLLVACEALLQVAARLSPTVDLLLANRYGAEPYVDDARFGRRPNPRYGDHDAWGFRNARVPAQAALVALGDSQTYGISARREDAWPQQLGRLTGSGVYNMACGGWGPSHYLLLLPQVLELRPRVVLMALYTGNDIWDALEMTYVRHGVPQLEPLATAGPEFTARVRAAQAELERASAAAARLMTPGFTRPAAPAPRPGTAAHLVALVRERSKLWGALRALRTRLRPRHTRDDAAAASAAAAPARWQELRSYAATSQQVAVCETHGVRTALDVGYRLRAFDSELWPEGLRLALASLQIAHERLAARGVQSLVVLIPTKELVFYDVCSEDVRARGAYATLQERETQARLRAQAFLDGCGIAWVDTAPALVHALRAGVAAYPETTDSHPNGRGYAVIAAAVARRLGNDGALP